MTPRDAIVNSALWAAYGDALGFITELADPGGLRARAKVERVTTTIPWVRRIGGQFGVRVNLPAGCYSDDTQLRLATSRSVRPGAFDVEAFAKVELPVWLVYALGAGRGTKAAATSLVQPNRSWSTNVFATRQARYIDAGGNGAAMRIQPHVWAAREWESTPATFVPDVVKNVLCTHGHPRAFVGAVVHALCLRYCLVKREAPGPDVWRSALSEVTKINDILEQDSELRTVWLPLWEAEAHAQFGEALINAITETSRDAELAEEFINLKSGDRAETYRQIAMRLGCLDEIQRGSATKTALMANSLVILFQESPGEGLQVASNLLGSDTDSIATMAGAMFGAFTSQPPPGEVADASYISFEAARMATIHNGEYIAGFTYPDLLRWTPPARLLDYVGSDMSSHLAIAGLGEVRPIGKPYAQADSGGVWQWLELKFGQRILAKRRERPRPLDPSLLPDERSPEDRQQQRRPVEPAPRPRTTAKNPLPYQGQPPLFGTGAPEPTAPPGQMRTAGQALAAGIRRLEASRYDPKTLGETVLELAARPDGYELLVSLTVKIIEAQNRNPSRAGGAGR